MKMLKKKKIPYGRRTRTDTGHLGDKFFICGVESELPMLTIDNDSGFSIIR